MPARVELLEEPGFAGRLVGAEGGGLLFEGSAEKLRRVALEDLLEIRFAAAQVSAAADLAEIHLGGGRLLRGRLAGGKGETLQLLIGGRSTLAIPYGSFAKLEVPARAGRRTLQAAPGGELDRIYKVVGEQLDLIEGIVTGYDDKSVHLERSGGEEVAIPFGALAAIVFGASDEPAPAAGVLVEVRLRDGSSVCGRLRGMAGSALTLAPLVGAPLSFALEEISALLFSGPRFVRLGTLVPAAVRRVPFFEDGLEPLYCVDRSIAGNPLRVAGRYFAHGIALRPICDLSYDLGGRFRALRVRVGIDDDVRPEQHRGLRWFATVRFHIDVDGQQAWSSPIVRAGQSALEVPAIDLRGVRRLTLRTDFADDFPAGDFPLWLEPILLR